MKLTKKQTLAVAGSYFIMNDSFCPYLSEEIKYTYEATPAPIM